MAVARACIKCGRPVDADESMCAVCNRAGMATPSATQYHGTVVVAIVVAVTALALGAALSVRGVGPYHAEVTGVDPVSAGYDVTVAVRNDGSRSGRAQCRVLALDDAGRRLRAPTLLTPPIGAGETLSVTERLTGLDEPPAQVTVTCS